VIDPNQGFMRQLLALEQHELGSTSLEAKWYDDDWGKGKKKKETLFFEW
jgi:hypothetical protein